MCFSSRRVSFTMLIAALALASGTAVADLIEVRIDFSTSGTAPGGNWNTKNTALDSPINLLNFNSGLDSGADLTLSVAAGNGTWADITGNWQDSNPGPAWLDAGKNAAKDGFKLNGSGTDRLMTIVLSGLAGSKYDVELVASRNQSSTVTATFAIGADSVVFNKYSQGYVNGEWLTWTNVVPTGGSITVTISNPDPNVGTAINAMRVLELNVPEPATLGLLSLGSLGIASLRRRRRHG
jgi:hypothetical protein